VTDKWPFLHHFFLFADTLILGLTTAAYPFCQHIYAFFVVGAVQGFVSGALDTGGNVLCLYVWRDGDSGPWMHAIHFGYAAGAFLAPLIVSPFLSTASYVKEELEKAGNMTEEEIFGVLQDKFGEEGTDTTIGIFYPLLGFLVVFISIGYLLFAVQAIRNWKKELLNAALNEAKESSEDKDEKKPMSKYIKAMVVLLGVFFFLYVGVEYTYGQYTTAFVVTSDLKGSKIQGTHVTAIFWGAFAVMRFIAIFAAIYLRPGYIMAFSFVFTLAGALSLVITANSSYLALQLGTAAMGFGMASIYATGILWLEQFVEITSMIGAYFTITSSIGPDVFPIVVGQFIESTPMFLMWLALGIVVGCICIFTAVAICGYVDQKEKETNST